MPRGARLILASRSPRRRALLADAGYAFEAVDPPFADPDRVEPADGETPEAHAVFLARSKALSLLELSPVAQRAGRVVLAADTLCVDAAGRCVGKPTSPAEARRVLAAFVEAEHAVVTGVCVIATSDEGNLSGQRAFAESAKVTWGAVSADELAAYVETEAWAGKAGGYNLFDRRDAGWPIAVAGDETCVVGLPMAAVAATLAEFGVDPASGGGPADEARP